MENNYWCYEIIYDRYNKYYFFAEVYYEQGKPVSWCKADFQGDTLKELGNEVDIMFKTYINQMTYKRIDRNGRLIVPIKQEEEELDGNMD